MAAVVSNKTCYRSCIDQGAFRDENRIDDAGFKQVFKFIGQTIVAISAFRFIDFLCDEIALSCRSYWQLQSQGQMPLVG